TLAAGDGLCSHDDGVEPAAAIALQHRTRDLYRQAGQEPGMPPHAAAVLARLIGATDDDVLDLFRVEGALLDELGDDCGQHVVGPHPGEGAGVAAEGGAQSVVDIAVEHGRFLLACISPRRPAAVKPGERPTRGAWL